MSDDDKSKPPVLSGYQLAIAKACGVTDVKELYLIEEVMRSDRPTLDALRTPEFNRLARWAQKALEDPELRALYAQSIV